MLMTAPGRGIGDVLRDDACSRIRTVSVVSEVDVELVWGPRWNLSRMSDAARLELGMF
jgi:metal-sulfur cluster biosynthetic enzyme